MWHVNHALQIRLLYRPECWISSYFCENSDIPARKEREQPKETLPVR